MTAVLGGLVPCSDCEWILDVSGEGLPLVGRRLPVTGRTLAWSRGMGSPDGVIAQFMALEAQAAA